MNGRAQLVGFVGISAKFGPIVRKATDMITIAFSNGDLRTFGAWCRPAVVQAYCDKHGITAEIVAFTPR